MRSKKFLLISVSYLVVLVLGIYMGQKANTHKEIDTRKETSTDTSKNKHKETKEIEETAPDGTKKKTKIVTEDETTEKKKTQDVSTHKEETIIQPKKTLHLNGLVGIDTSRQFTPVYGVSASKEVFGPITLGAFGLTNGTFGASLGISF